MTRGGSGDANAKGGRWSYAIEILLYPLIGLVCTPLRLLQALWRSRVVLLNPRRFIHFVCPNALNVFFYRTRALDFHRFGRSGISPYQALGNCRIASQFFYTKLSLYAYEKWSAALLLLGMLAWVLGHAVYLDGFDDVQCWAVMGLLLGSTIFYCNAFILQNYNVLGWVFFPLFLERMIAEDPLGAGLWLVVIAFVSFTLCLIGILCLGVLFLLSFSWSWIFAAIPAGLKFSTHFLYLLRRDASAAGIAETARAVGAIRTKVQYKRTLGMINLAQLYSMGLYGVFIACFYWETGGVPALLWVGLVIGILNIELLRFADYQSVQLLVVSLAAAYTLQVGEAWLLLPLFIVANPIAISLIAPQRKGVISIVPKIEPVTLEGLIEQTDSFLAAVPKNGRVFQMFRDPCGDRNRLFDGFRMLIEPLHYCCSKREIHFMPTWGALTLLNYEGAPRLWGNSLEDARALAKQWQAGYVIVYTDGSDLDKNLLAANDLEICGSLDWNEFGEILEVLTPPDHTEGRWPTLWLLRVCGVDSVTN